MLAIQAVKPVFLIAVILGIAACGGGGSSSTAVANGATVSGVKLPNSVSVIKPQALTPSQLLAGVTVAYEALASNRLKPLAVNVPTTSDFATEESYTLVDIIGQDQLNGINSTLCFISQMGADTVLKKIPSGASYTAKINGDICNPNNSGSPSQSLFVLVTVNVTPKTTLSPASIKFWLEFPKTIDLAAIRSIFEVTVTEAATVSNPLGIWQLSANSETQDINGNWISDTITGSAVGGFMQAKLVNGQPEIQTFDGYQFANSTFEEAITVRYTSTNTDSGRANIQKKLTLLGINGAANTTSLVQAALAFNPTLAYAGLDRDGDGALTSAVDKNICHDRTNFTQNIFDYGLYNAVSGQRIVRQTNFFFTTIQTNGTKANGFAGSWGASLEDGSALSDGQSVQKINLATGGTQTLTTQVSSSQLTQRTATRTLTINDLIGQAFSYRNNTGSSLLVHFDKVTGHLIATKELNINLFSAPITGQTPLTFPVDLTDGTNTNALGFFLRVPDYLDSTSYQLQIAANTNPTLTTSIEAISFDSIVSPYDTALTTAQGLTLYCWSSCPVGGNVANTHATTPISYQATAVNGKIILTDTTNSTTVTGNTTNPVNMYGLTTTNAGAGTGTIQYNFQSNGVTNTVSFTDATGTPFVFDAPLNLTYTHNTANDRNADATFNGKTFSLNYNGFRLSGLPWSTSTSGPMALKDGVTVTDGTQNYLIRGLFVDQIPAELASNSCISAGLDNSGIFSSLPLPTTADMTALTFSWADKPNITSSPLVVEGKIQ